MTGWIIKCSALQMSSGIVKATQKLWHNLIILAEKDTRASAPTSTIREIHFIYGKSRESRVCVCVCVHVWVNQSHVQLFATPWTGQIGSCQAPLSMGFSRQGYWSGLLFPSPEDLPDLGTEPGSPAVQADSLLSDAPRGALSHQGQVSVTTRHLHVHVSLVWISKELHFSIDLKIFPSLKSHKYVDLSIPQITHYVNYLSVI